MWSSRIILERFRASTTKRRIPVRHQVGSSSSHNYRSHHATEGKVRWIYVPDITDDNDETGVVQQRQRRYLTTGRRHGWKSISEKQAKGNFAKEFLEPAARGELKEKHSSGIPKLAVRKHKGHGIKGGDDNATVEEDIVDLEEIAATSFEESNWDSFGQTRIEELPDDIVVDDWEDDDDGNLMTTMSKDISRATSAPKNRQSGDGGRGGGGGGDDDENKKLAPFSPRSDKPGVYTLEYDNGRRPDYWREEDYDDDILTEEDKAFVRELVGFDDNSALTSTLPLASGGDDDEIDFSDFDFDSIDFDASDSEDEDVDDEEDNGKVENIVAGNGDVPATESTEVVEAAASSSSNRKVKAVDDFVDDFKDDEDRWGPNGEGKRPPKELYDAISPLKISGPTDEDFWYDLRNHPTMYAEVRHYHVHPESKREPKPYFPQNRANPAPEFVDFYVRWLYVAGLPPALSGEGMKHGVHSKLTALQEQEVEKTVTRLLGVSYEQVFPANETSAFVGFESPEGREAVLKRGPIEKALTRPVTISPYTPSAEDDKYDFVKGASPNTIVKLENLPPWRFSRDTLARDLFPEGSELSAAYRITRDQVVFPSPTTALIHFQTDEQAGSALSSESVAARLEELGEYPVRLFRARKELVHNGMGGPLKDYELRKLGTRLIVDGDMPSKGFHISHAGTIMLRNLDFASVTKESITEFFQPFSNIIRDEQGSIEFVTCEDGSPTDRAYVGFERLGEAEAVMKALKGRARIGANTVTMRLVKDRKIPGAPPRVARPERTEEEILKSLNDWEQYVDQEDIEFLEKNGVAKVVIDEALRGMRFSNRSFGSLDWAMRDEKLEPEKESGYDYKELVQMYISTLKDCIATPENPGDMYEGLHFPGEPIDLSIFEREKKRQKMLMKKRGL